MNKTKLSEFLEGSKVTLQKHKESLAPTMFKYIDKDRERLNKFLPWVPFIKDENNSLEYIKQTHIDWEECKMFDYGIFRKSDNAFIGNLGVNLIRRDYDRCEIGYWIFGDYEGQGLVSDALRTIEKHLF